MDAQQQLVLSKDQVQLPPNATLEHLVMAIRHIFSRPSVQQVIIESGKPIQVTWHKRPGDQIGGLPEPVDPIKVLDYIHMDEMPLTAGLLKRRDPFEILVALLSWIGAKGLYPTHVLLSPKTIIRKWLRLPVTFPLYNRLVGMDVLAHSDVHPDVMIVLGCQQKAASYSDAVYALKLYMEAPTDGSG